ncbi:MAG: MFS transporter, partial [Dehalococcoidia bacterium]
MLDELVYGLREAAWPLVRADFRLSYAAIGVLLTVPSLVGATIELAFGVLADAGFRRWLVTAGGVAFAAALCFIGVAWGFLPLLLAFSLLSPASGAFVSLSQTALMDFAPDRHEANMIRWTVAGYVGVLLGPAVLAGAVALGFGWRAPMLALAVVTLPLVVLSRSIPTPPTEHASFRRALRSVFAAARQLRVLCWLVVLQFTDLLGDVLLGYLALYFVDVARSQPVQATLAVGLWS